MCADAAGELRTLMLGEFAAQLQLLNALAEKHGCRFITHLPPPASHADIALAEAFISAPLPPSLKALFREHDGMSLAFYDTDMYERYGELATTRAKLEIHGASGIIVETEDFRSYVDPQSDRELHQTNRCVEFANVFGALHRLVLYIDAPRPSGEYAIIEADVGCGEWTADLDTLATILVANSFAEFLRRALRFMLETERGFSFWHPDLEPWWPR